MTEMEEPLHGAHLSPTQTYVDEAFNAHPNGPIL